MRLLLLWILSIALPLSPAFAQSKRVLVLGAENETALLDEVVGTLDATGEFQSVAWINAADQTPTLNTLLGYDAVLVWSNWDFHDSTTLGNNLADFVDQGGGVVVAIFATTGLGSSLNLQGRWVSGNYRVMMADAGSTSGQASLGTIHAPGHDILLGVTDFDGGSAGFRGTGANLSPGSYRVADWDDQRILIAVNDDTTTPRVDLNFYPPSDVSRFDFWRSDTDGDRLLANALLYTANGGQPFLEIRDAVPGATMTFYLENLRPDSDVVTLLSSRGPGPTSSPFGAIDVTQPWRRTPPFRADSAGQLDFTITLPAAAAGRTLYAQSVEFAPEGEPRLSFPASVTLP